MKTDGVAGSRPPARAARRAARLSAVQALYQLEMSLAEPSPQAVIREFLTHRIGAEGDGPSASAADPTLFSDLVTGVARERHDIDDMVAGALAEDWTVERLDSVMRAILRAGTYELSWRLDVPARVVIDEYVGLAHTFFSGKEPAMVNGVLDHLARHLRPEDMEAAARR